MKHLLSLFLALLTLGMASCGASASDSSKDSGTVYMSEDYYLIRVRGCDYVSHNYTYYPMLVHAGDCTNPIHQTDTIR